MLKPGDIVEIAVPPCDDKWKGTIVLVLGKEGSGIYVYRVVVISSGCDKLGPDYYYLNENNHRVIAHAEDMP